MRLALLALTVVALAGCGGGSDSPPEARIVTVTATVPTSEAPPAATPSPPKSTPPPTTTTQLPSTTSTVPEPVEISMLPYLRSLPGSTSAGPNSTARAATITADGRYLIVRAAINGGLAEDANARVVSGASTADVPDLTPGNYLIKYAIDMEYSATEPGGPIDDIDVLTDQFILRGPPAFIRSDNGPECIAEAVRRWITAVGARLPAEGAMTDSVPGKMFSW